MSLPTELIQPISEFKTAAVKVLVIVLILGIMALWGNSLYDKVQDKKTFEDKAEIYKVELDYWKRIATVKDSLYQDCSDKRYKDATNTETSLKYRNNLNDTIKNLIKEIK